MAACFCSGQLQNELVNDERPAEVRGVVNIPLAGLLPSLGGPIIEADFIAATLSSARVALEAQAKMAILTSALTWAITMSPIDFGSFPLPETVSENSLQQYLKHAKSVRNACVKDLGGNPNIPTVIRWFVARDHEFAGATIRGYRAGLRHEMECAVESGTLDAERYQALLGKLATGPVPKSKGARRRTSARKRKSLGGDLIARLLGALRRSDRKDGFDEFLVDYVRFSLTFFPRPSEWAGATIIHVTDPETGAVISRRLRFPNSKHSNGRSFGPMRELDISTDMRLVRDLMHFLRMYRTWIAAFGSPERFQAAIRNRLAYVAKVAGLPRIAPYTFRHTGMAAAKQEMDQVQVSYAAGHASDRTKIDHYARSRPSSGGWVSPSEAKRGAYLEAKAELRRPKP